MRRSQRPLTVASRTSLLARAQAQMVGQALGRLNPDITIDYLWLESEADQRPEASLAQAGGKGLFARAIEQALRQGRADLAVHSLKDLPARAPEQPEAAGAGLVIAAVPPRADVRDCLITRSPATGLADLPQGAVLGTASPRRTAQVRRLRPDLRIELIRGNIDTRLRKVLEGAASPNPERRYDATLLAVAGLERAGLSRHAGCPIDPAVMLPAACQGALALQCRTDDHVTLLRCLPLNDPAAAAACHAERQIVAGLAGDCHSPIGVLAEVAGPNVRIRVRVLSPDGAQCVEAEHSGQTRRLGKLVKAVLRDLEGRGARTLLAAAR